MNAARKLKQCRKANQKKKNKASIKGSKPKQANSHCRGVVIERYGLEAKQPNSGIRKCVRVQLIATGQRVNAFVPFDGGMNYVDENDEVLLQRYKKSIGDLCGIKYKVIDVHHRPLKNYLAGKYERRPRT